MNLYLVGPTKQYDYDEFDAFIIRAESEEEAREIAQATARGEEIPGVVIPDYYPERFHHFRLRNTPMFPNNFKDPNVCPCVLLSADGPKAILSASYNRG